MIKRIKIAYSTLLNSTKKKKIGYFDHATRKSKYIQTRRVIIQEEILGKRSVCPQQNLWLKDLRYWMRCTLIVLFRVAVSKIISINRIANFRLIEYERRRKRIVWKKSCAPEAYIPFPRSLRDEHETVIWGNF